MKPKDTYFAAYFNKQGKLVGAEDMNGRPTKPYRIEDLTLDNVNDIREVSIIMRTGHSPCCIKQGPFVFCWCADI